MSVYALPTGTLTLAIHRADWAAEELFTLGARENPKRGFLFVSKVLGKHWPVTPQILAQVHEALAARLPQDTPTLFVGMAETATGFAQGVFEAWLARSGRRDACYVHSSRLHVPGVALCAFEESHSHAAQQWLHLPMSGLEAVQTLVLLDDELSTGNTFRALAEALRPHLPQLRDIHWVCLTDFSPHADDGITRHSLLAGQWQFAPAAMVTNAPAAQGRAVEIADSGFGRLGIDHAVQLPAALIGEYAAQLRAGDKVLVLGTGEFIHPPQVFARELQALSGAQVWVQSSTRSPALVWGGLQHKRTFADPYDEGVPYYLYNVPDGAYDHIFLCHEHPANAALQHTAAELHATLVPLYGETPCNG